MTHSLHRQGSADSLQGFFIILFRVDPAIPEQLSYKGTTVQRANKILKILKKIPIVALEVETTGPRLRYMDGWNKHVQDSGLHQASKIEDIFECGSLTWVRHVIIKGKENIIKLLTLLKKEDLGVSVVVSGIFREIETICKAVDTAPHSFNLSLGVFGKIELLPGKEIHQFCTMCGHSIIAPNLVRKLVDDVRNGHCSSIEAAVELGKQCTCNIFNIERALKMMVAK